MAEGKEVNALAIFFTYTFVVVVVLVFYLFHFNRLYTLLLVRLLQWYTRFKYKIFIDVGNVFDD